MLTFIKIIFIVVAGVFIVSALNDGDFLGDFTLVGNTYSSPSDGPLPRGTYNRSYDENNDGRISDREYEAGEKKRIEDEIAYIREQLAAALAEQNESPYADLMSLGEGNAGSRDPDREYVQIRADISNDRTVTVSGWKLKSIATGKAVVIPTGSSPKNDAGRRRASQTVMLGPGYQLYVVSGDARDKDQFEEASRFAADDDWVTYLRQSRELWRNSHDAILLYDKEGLIVDYVSY